MNIRAFRGYRYDVDAWAGGRRDATAVVAPPYDQVGPETEARLLALSPHNVVRVTCPRAEPGGDRYERARETLGAWLASGVFRPDEEPAIYPYHLHWTLGDLRGTRVGFVALGEATPYVRGIVRPHERTHRGPKEDRLRLLEATRADLGVLLMLVSDPDRGLMRLAGPDGDPVLEAHDLAGNLHRLWRVTDREAIERVRSAMQARAVVIADGHHRYETAVEYARRHPDDRWKLMAFSGLEDPGLAILASHRLVHHVAPAALADLPRAAAPWFDVSPLADPDRFRPTAGTFALVTAAGALRFDLRPDASERIDWPAGKSPAWRALAVAVLHEGVLRPLLGIGEAELEAESHVDYVADPAQAVRLVRQGACQAAFLIAPVGPAEILAVTAGGELLPQKSTHFYPKLLDGLVFHRLDDG